jgi:hypothetical protein
MFADPPERQLPLFGMHINSPGESTTNLMDSPSFSLSQLDDLSAYAARVINGGKKIADNSAKKNRCRSNGILWAKQRVLSSWYETVFSNDNIPKQRATLRECLG